MGTNKVLVVGDPHISDKFKGKHKDYLSNCFYCMDKITETIKEEGITHLIVLGDWIGIGQNEKNLSERGVLLKVIQLLQLWNKLTNNNVYSIKGNHDIGSKLTDYELFESLGLLQNPKTLDFPSTRVHMFNYGEEQRAIEIAENKYNVGCFHANLLIEGLTTWYRGGEGVELSTLENLYGMDLALAGHIHNPSPKKVQTSIRDREIELFYPGNMTRPKYEPNLWEHAYGVLLTIGEEETTREVVVYDLKPVSEVFTTTFDEVEVKDGTEPIFDIEALTDVLNELNKYNIGTGQEYEIQVQRVAGLDKVGADLAMKYIEQVQNEFKR